VNELAKKVFFSFHYDDVVNFRANVVRRHWQFKPDRESAGFFDASIWESAKKDSPLAVKRLINQELVGTSVTCVLIGSETHERPWVRYEILKSFLKGNKLIGVHINSINGRDQKTKLLGADPFGDLNISYSIDGESATIFEWSGSTWKPYSQIEGTATFSMKGVSPMFWGKTVRFTEFARTYDWVADDGYNNFASWVE